MIPGLDTHAGYGVIDFQKVKDSGYRFVWAKCTEGNQGAGRFVDPQFKRTVAECKRLDIAVGAYHFAFPLPEGVDSKGQRIVGRSPKEQALIAFTNSAGLGSQLGDLAHAVDAEWPPPNEWKKWGCWPEQISQWLKEYCEEATRLFGRKPVIYTYPSWFQTLSTSADTSWAAEYDLWFANYEWPGPGIPPDGWNPPLLNWVSKTWKDWAVCQHSADNSAVKVPGISAAHVDRNVIKDERTLARLQGLEYIELG